MKLFLIFFVLIGGNQSLASDCEKFSILKKLFPIKVNHGQTVHPSELEELIPNSSDFIIDTLGYGRGGRVYRFTPQQGKSESFIIKIMDKEKALNDESAFKIYRKIAVNQSDVQIVKTEFWNFPSLENNKIFKISDIKGRSLFQLLADDQIPLKIKTKLLKKYNRFAARVQSQLNSEHGASVLFINPDRNYFPEMELVIDRFEREKMLKLQPKIIDIHISISKINLTLKSDNIIVNEKFKMFLIDPH